MTKKWSNQISSVTIDKFRSCGNLGYSCTLVFDFCIKMQITHMTYWVIFISWMVLSENYLMTKYNMYTKLYTSCSLLTCTSINLRTTMVLKPFCSLSMVDIIAWVWNGIFPWFARNIPLGVSYIWIWVREVSTTTQSAAALNVHNSWHVMFGGAMMMSGPYTTLITHWPPI